MTDEEREELAALIAEEESLLAEIEMVENERLTEEGNKEMKDHAAVDAHVEVEVVHESAVEVDVEVLPVPIEFHVQESEVQSLDDEGIVVEKDMVTIKTGADNEREGKVVKEGQQMVVQIEEREVEKTGEKEDFKACSFSYRCRGSISITATQINLDRLRIWLTIFPQAFRPSQNRS